MIENMLTTSIYRLLLILGKITENIFEKNNNDAFNINEKTLYKILNRNKNTQIGKEYNFKSIKNIEEYKKNFPLTDYLFYEKYINDILSGKNNILTKDKIEYLGHTSGTTGKQKLIPVSKKSRLIVSKYMAFLIQKIIYNNYKNEYSFNKGLLLTDISDANCKLSDKIPICSATSGGMKKMKHLIPYIYTTPLDIMYIQNKNIQLYLHALFALNYKDLMYISGVFVSAILDFFRIIEDNNKLLINDIKTGRINSKINIDNNLRKKLNKLLKPNASLADKLEKEFNKGFNGIAQRLWPKLFIIICVSGANFTIYEKQLNYYTNSLPIYSPSLAATEAFVGANPFKDITQYVITPDTAFFEFINIKDSDKKDPYTYTLNKLIKNEAYEIVLTNYAGLYRYKLNDVIKITGYYRKSPTFEFLYRKNQLLNMTSEKTTESHVKAALHTFAIIQDIIVKDYTTYADNSVTPGHYTFFIEFVQITNLDKIKKMEICLDNELMIANPAYKRFRNKEQLSCLKINILKNGTFEKLKDLLIQNGTSKNQIKIPRVIKNNSKKLLNLLHENTINP